MSEFEPETTDTGTEEFDAPETEDTGAEESSADEAEHYDEDDTSETEETESEEPEGFIFAGQRYNTRKEAEQAYMDANRRANEAERERPQYREPAKEQVDPEQAKLQRLYQQEYSKLQRRFGDTYSETELSQWAAEEAYGKMELVRDVKNEVQDVVFHSSPEREQLEQFIEFSGLDKSVMDDPVQRRVLLQTMRGLYKRAGTTQPAPKQDNKFYNKPRSNRRDAGRGGRSSRPNTTQGQIYIPRSELTRLREAGMSEEAIKQINEDYKPKGRGKR